MEFVRIQKGGSGFWFWTLMALCVALAAGVSALPSMMEQRRPDRHYTSVVAVQGRILAHEHGGRVWAWDEKRHPESSTRTIPLGEMKVDGESAVWGLYSWIGIHEPAAASLAVSRDLGRSFEVYTVPPEKMRPIALLDAPDRTALLLTDRGDTWNVNTGPPETWTLAQAGPGDGAVTISGLKTKHGTYISDGRSVLYQEDGSSAGWQTTQGVPPDIVRNVGAFFRHEQDCWAIHAGGLLIRSKCDELTWVRVAYVPGLRANAIYATADEVFIAGQDNNGSAYAAKVSRDGIVEVLHRGNGGQMLDVTYVKPIGAIFTGDGLFWDKSGELEPLNLEGHPAEDSWFLP